MDWLHVMMLGFFASAIALAKECSRSVLAVLGVGAIAALAPLNFQTWQDQVQWFMAVDAFICLSCYLVWAKQVNMKAWSVGCIGLLKNIVSFLFLTSPNLMPWIVFAAVFNAAFVLQVLCAGGFCNAIGAWLDDCLLRIAPKRHSLLRNGG